MNRALLISCSLGASGPRSSNGTPGTSGSHPRRRIAATVLDAPSHTKETEDIMFRELLQQSEQLEAVYWAREQSVAPQPDLSKEFNELAWTTNAAPVVEEEQEEEENPRHTSSRAASTSGLNLQTADPEPLFVRSTRLARSKRTKSTRAVAVRSSRTSSKSTPLATLSTTDETDELAQDAAFLAKLRAWLRNSRSSKRSRNMKNRPAGIGTPTIGSSTYSSFLSSLGNIPLLSAKQEKRLATIICRGIAVRNAAQTLASATGKRPSLEDVATAAGLPSAQAAARSVVMAEDARGLMVEFNIRMVISIAKRYINKGLDTSDLIPEGVIGLKKAIERFDPSKGFRFSTYAHWWIRQAITRAISEQGRDVRLPVHVVETLMRLNKVRSELSSQPDRDGPPTHKELAAAMGLPLNRLVALLRVTRNPKTVEDVAMLRAGGGGTGGVKEMGRDISTSAEDIYIEEEDDFSVDPVMAGERSEVMRETITLLLSTLDTRERNIMRLRYGLHYYSSSSEVKRALEAIEEELLAEGNATETRDGWRTEEEEFSADERDVGESGLGLKATGDLYHLSRERIRQLESRALKKLRSPWRLRLAERLREGQPLGQKDVSRLLQAAADSNSFY